MASSSIIIQFLSFSFLLFLCSSSSAAAKSSFRPKALVMAVTKDASTLQYLTKIKQRTPLVSLDLTVNLGGEFLWVDCHNNNYVSSSYRPVRCGSPQCSLAQSNACNNCYDVRGPGCNNNTCGTFPYNPIIGITPEGELAEDAVSVTSTNGANPGRAVTVSRFIFGCGSTDLLRGLGNGAVGVAGLGQTRISIPSQFSSSFGFSRKFAICLTSSTGVIFFGDGPYNLLPDIEASQLLTYTPLLINPVGTPGTSTASLPSAEYFIRVKSIKIDDKRVALNSSLLKIDTEGYGGTMISTVNPYTLLETSIFKAVTKAFIKHAAARNITRVAPIAPFEVCFSADNVVSTRVGPSVPGITLVLKGKNASWTITGSNSIVHMRKKNALCLAFLDGGLNPATRFSIVIGGYQLEDNLLQFDLANSRLGFSSTLLGRRTTCANFNFTTSA